MQIELGNESNTKRDSFRKEIRRRQIDNIIALKRKLACEQFELHIDEKSYKQTMESLFEAIKSNYDLDQKLTKLGNFLFQVQSLSLTKQQLGQQKMQDLCLKITGTIFNVIIPSLMRRNQQDQGNRKKCLTIVSNIMADSLAPHNLLLPIISEGINNNYPDLVQLSNDEAVEIGWILTNALCHRLDLSLKADLQKSIEQILSMTQHMIMIPNLEMIGTLYRSLRTFYQHVDNFFHANHTQIEHYKIHRLIILEQSINYNLNVQELGSTITHILAFIESNILYIDSCEERLAHRLCKKCFSILGCTSSDKIMVSALSLVKKISHDHQIITLIIKDYFQIIQNCLMYHGTIIKLEVLRLLVYLCIDLQKTAYMCVNLQLETIMCELVKTIRDPDTLMQMMVLVKIIVSQTDRKCGMAIINTIEEHLLHRPGDVGREALNICEELQDNKKGKDHT